MSDIPAVVGLEPVAWMCTVEDVSGYYYYYIVGDKRPDQDHTTFEPLYLATDVARLQAKLAAMTQERDQNDINYGLEKADHMRTEAQLAASQAYAQQLREALKFVRLTPEESAYWLTQLDAAIALPQDDTALREWGAKLLEEMRENCHYDRDADMLRHKTAELMGQ